MARPKVDQNRAQNIIEAADELFARYGYERTSIEDIARHLGIGKGSIYLDFRTKEEILFKILERYAESMQKKLRAKVEDDCFLPLDVLRDNFTTDAVACYDRVSRDFHTPEAFLHTSIAMKEHFASFFVTRRKLIHTLLLKASDRGDIRSCKATEETARALMMATSSLYPPYLDNYSETVTIKCREDLVKAAPVIADLLIAGLRSSAISRDSVDSVDSSGSLDSTGSSASSISPVSSISSVSSGSSISSVKPVLPGRPV